MNIEEYIINATNLKIKLELPFGIISFPSFVNIETVNIISSDVKINELLANNLNDLFYCFLNFCF